MDSIRGFHVFTLENFKMGTSILFRGWYFPTPLKGVSGRGTTDIRNSDILLEVPLNCEIEELMLIFIQAHLAALELEVKNPEHATTFYT